MAESKLEEQIRIGKKGFQDNKENFYREIRRQIRDSDGDFAFNETTTVKVFLNYNSDLIPHYKFIYKSELGGELSTEYYPQYFKNNNKDNIDLDYKNDIEILSI